MLSLLFITTLSIGSLQVYSWGFFAHKRINRLSVFTLPAGMIEVYKTHIEYLTENAVAPDKRRYGPSGSAEAPRHYIDIDHFGESPFDSMPRFWKDAVHKYTEDTLQVYGIVPFEVVRTIVFPATWSPTKAKGELPYSKPSTISPFLSAPTI